MSRSIFIAGYRIAQAGEMGRRQKGVMQRIETGFPIVIGFVFLQEDAGAPSLTHRNPSRQRLPG